MRIFPAGLLVLMIAGCENGGKVKADLDTTVKDVKNSAVLDSIEAKGDRLMDGVKSKGSAVLDSSKVRGVRPLNKAGEGLKKLSKKLDSTK